MNPADRRRLQDLFQRASRSLLQYARAAVPYTARADRKVLEVVNRIGAEDAAAIGQLSEFLEGHRLDLPPLGSFPVAYTDLNYIGVRSLLPRLVAELRRGVAALEADAAAATDAEAQREINRLLDHTRRHLAELDAL